MFGKKHREDMLFLLRYGDATLKGHSPTDEEQQKFIEARNQSIKVSKLIFKFTDDEINWNPGEPI